MASKSEVISRDIYVPFWIVVSGLVFLHLISFGKDATAFFKVARVSLKLTDQFRVSSGG